MTYTSEWKSIVERITKCRKCRKFPLRLRRRPPWNGCRIFDPKEILSFKDARVLFLSEAPPGGIRTTFFQCNPRDGLRSNMQELISEVFRERFAPPKDFFTEFTGSNCYLLPSFSYACGDGAENWNPGRPMIIHSSSHLKDIIEYLGPKTVVTLGQRALWMAHELGLVMERRRLKLKHYLDANPHQENGTITYVTYWPRLDYTIHRDGFLRCMQQLRRDGYFSN